MYVLNTSRYLSTSNENISLCSAAASSYAMRCDAMRCMGSQKMCDRQHSSETHSLNKLSAATNRHDEYANWRHIWREKTSSGLSLSSSSLNCASFVKAITIERWVALPNYSEVLTTWALTTRTEWSVQSRVRMMYMTLLTYADAYVCVYVHFTDIASTSNTLL